MSEHPKYLELLQPGELERRVHALEQLLERCPVCPLDCCKDRLQDELARCYSGRLPVVSSASRTSGKSLRS